MTKPVLTTYNFQPTLDLRKSLALVLFGFVALFASLNLEHNRHIHQGLSGQLETSPIADIALLLHKETVVKRALTFAPPSDTDNNDDKNTHASFWLALANLDLILYRANASYLVSALPTLFYASPRTQTYSPRAPPRI